jgi:hypothetical protein
MSPSLGLSEKVGPPYRQTADFLKSVGGGGGR